MGVSFGGTVRGESATSPDCFMISLRAVRGLLQSSSVSHGPSVIVMVAVSVAPVDFYVPSVELAREMAPDMPVNLVPQVMTERCRVSFISIAWAVVCVDIVGRIVV